MSGTDLALNWGNTMRLLKSAGTQGSKRGRLVTLVQLCTCSTCRAVGWFLQCTSLCIFHCIRHHQPCCWVCACVFAVLLLFFIQEVKHLPLLFIGPVDSPLDLEECTQILPLLSVSVIRGFMLLICLMIQREFLAASTRSSWLFLAYRYVCEGLSLGLHLLTSDTM